MNEVQNNGQQSEQEASQQPAATPQQPTGYVQPPMPTVPAPLYVLTTGMKVAWLFIGLLMGIPGMLIAWAVNADKMPQVKKEAFKFSVIGFAISVVLGIILVAFYFWFICLIVSAIPMSVSTW